MRPIGVRRLPRHDDLKAVCEGVLNGRTNADIGLDAGDDDAIDLLFAKEKGQIGGEKRAVAALGADNLARALRAEALEERRVRIADDMMARQLAPLVVVEARIVLLDSV